MRGVEVAHPRAQCRAANRSAVVLRWYQPSLRSFRFCPLLSALCSVSASSVLHRSISICRARLNRDRTVPTGQPAIGGRLFVRKPVQLAEHHHFAIVHRQPQNRVDAAGASPARAISPRPGRSRWRMRLRLRRPSASMFTSTLRAAPFVALQHQMPRDAIQIGRQRRHRRIESAGALRQRDEHVLRDILGSLAGAEHLPAEPVHGAVVPAKDDGQRLAIARCHAIEQFRICRFGRHAHG